MNSRSQLSKEIQTRLTAGESKANIYNALKSTFPAGAVERSLAQWPLPAAKTAARQMNVPLVIIAVFFALLRLMLLIGAFQTLESGQILRLMPLAILPLLIHAYVIYGVMNFNLIGYMLLILMALNNLFNIAKIGFGDPKIMMVLALSLAAIVLSLIQKRKLFPNTSWFLRHKRDASGNPIF